MAKASLADVLSRCAREANNMAAMAERLDCAIGTRLSPDDRHGLQEADLLRQSLQELSKFLDALSASLPSELRLDVAAAAEGLVRRDLANRLGSGWVGDDAAADTSGEPVFF